TDELDVRVLEQRDVVPQLAQLTGADPGEREGIEDEGDVPVSREVGEPHDLAVLVLEGEAGRERADLRRHGDQSCSRLPAALYRRPPLGVARRVPVQSRHALMVLVACSPAV